ncbi:MAG: enoyl-CoA hydratase-related protein [Edaphobacter sp.]|uniref:enoyl-CoA hydratase/isomerase family protein n=1 Tax=Edaphobacter sp. TaxID=1934404 RepID=UPI0023A44D49|nr:enoyl-CoA hydratase-related protein [Edaphobacter sp.]MDE1176147.1 enoyl-CoA hydratase-related protein [Edaphobacter sp.]
MEAGKDYETLLCETREQMATVTLNRPHVHNALNIQMFAELRDVFGSLARDPAIRVILLTGSGEKSFAAGADISELVVVNRSAGRALAHRGSSILRQIETCGKPVIALVNGFALGGGCELAMASTLRIASETATFGQPEARLGLIPGYGGTQRLPRLVGQSAALKLLLTAQIITAAEALRIGLVDEVVAPEKLLARGEEIARSILQLAPLAIAGCLEAVTKGADRSLDAGLSLEASIFGKLSGTDDKTEGTKAFLDKRPPVWTGR